MRALCFVAVVPSLMAACATPSITVVPPSLGCPVPEALTQSCLAPAGLRSGISYGDLLLAYHADRTALQHCAANQRDLLRLLEECQARMADYDASLVRRTRPNP